MIDPLFYDDIYCPIAYEEWKIIDFLDIIPNRYFISNFGRVFSLTKNNFMSYAISQGYNTVQLTTKDGNRKSYYVHILVGLAFVHNPDPSRLVEINHINLYRNDNFQYNLEWVTKKDNIIHEAQHRNHNIKQVSASKVWGDGFSTYGENNGMAKLKESQVRTMLSVIESGGTCKEALEKANVPVTRRNLNNLHSIIRGSRWKAISKDYNLPKHVS